ncbi:MAG: primosomal protein N', partial [Alphaproteobacteria bacterium]|nr:primosomal protein N' [Alphaproteobacteria bacterium]
FCEAIDACMASGQQALVLLPEISLTISLLQRFAARFGFMPTLWHSGLTPKQRRTRWWDIQQGTARLIVGARSALLLPYARLGLVVVDEEHDAGYKQDDSVLYQARDMAVARAHHEHIPIILSSATPSLEARHHARQKKYRHVVLPQRFGGAVLPDMALIDLRKEKLPAQSWLSVPARHEIAETHGRGEQSLIFINRRGYAPLTLCRACGARLQCPYCSAWLVQHKKNDRLQCHHCGHEKNLPPACHDCGAIDSWAHSGPGIERVAEECEKIFPHLRRCVISSDLVSAREMARLFADIAEHRVDIIIGTQLTTKGHHFPKLTTVVVVDADSGLTGADPRAGERSWQMLQFTNSVDFWQFQPFLSSGDKWHFNNNQHDKILI